jgi:putative transposase
MTMAPKSTPPAFSDEVLDQILATYTKPEDLTGKDGILKQLTARLVERALQAEMNEHLGYEKHDPKGRGTPNSRNGTTPKTLKTELGSVDHQGTPRSGGELRAPAGQETPEPVHRFRQ